MYTKRSVLFFTIILSILTIGCGGETSNIEKSQPDLTTIEGELSSDKQVKLDKEIGAQLKSDNLDYKVPELSADEQAKLDKEIGAQLKSDNLDYKVPELSADEQAKLDKEIGAQLKK